MVWILKQIDDDNATPPKQGDLMHFNLEEVYKTPEDVLIAAMKLFGDRLRLGKPIRNEKYIGAGGQILSAAFDFSQHRMIIDPPEPEHEMDKWKAAMPLLADHRYANGDINVLTYDDAMRKWIQAMTNIFVWEE